jgi:hypothetical protein
VIRRILAVAVAAFFVVTATALAMDHYFKVEPSVFDPAHTFLVQSTWLSGTGCPTNAKTYDGSTTSTYTDPACPTGDSKDKTNQGLLLVKTGPTANYAAAQAELEGVKGPITELGYDIRKPGPEGSLGPRGSHCGAGAPRFDIELKDGSSYFLGCNSPPATTQVPGTGWTRLRWGGSVPLLGYNASTGVLEPITGDVKNIAIVFDEGQDASGGPDQFGAAFLDNIDVNGVLVGQGAEGKHDEHGRDHEHGKHGGGDDD